LQWWDAGPEIQRHINRKISGDPEIDALQYTLDKYYAGRLPMGEVLSLGCGTGHLERSLHRLGAFRHCDAYDVAEGSIAIANREAEKAGIDRIDYHVADINHITLPANHYDSVWIFAALHHIENLEGVCQQISQSLKPNGLLVLQEYIGPSRFQFSARQKELANLCLALLPARYRARLPESVEAEMGRSLTKQGLGWLITRLIDKVRDGDLIGVLKRRYGAYRSQKHGLPVGKTEVVFPFPSDVIAGDPSEAVRSGEIMGILVRDFNILEKKDWGGNVLQFLLAGIAGNFKVEDPCSQALLKMLLDIEDTLLSCGELESDFAYMVASSKRRS